MGIRKPLARPSPPFVLNRLWGNTLSFILSSWLCRAALDREAIRRLVAHFHGDVGVDVGEAALAAGRLHVGGTVDGVQHFLAVALVVERVDRVGVLGAEDAHLPALAGLDQLLPEEVVHHPPLGVLVIGPVTLLLAAA